MSYWCYLNDPRTGRTLKLNGPNLMRGGIYAVGGNLAELNVTYNYFRIMQKYLPDPGIRWLDGKTGRETLDVLRDAIRKMRQDDEDESDYWKPTEGNVRRALVHLAALAEACPDGVWSIN
jgi:hypothetical protein